MREIYGVNIKKFEDVQIGDVAWSARTVTEADVMMFAQLSGDYAPHHVNKEFGETTMFHSRIAHGMLTAGLCTSVLRELCGDASYTTAQEIRFRSAVALNDTITVKGVVTGKQSETREASIEVICIRQGWKEGERPVIEAKFIQTMIIPSVRKGE